MSVSSNYNFLDFNNTKNQSFELIPAGTIAKVIMRIKPGGHNDYENGWDGGYATKSDPTGSVYLNCEFTIVSGKYKSRKIWSLIGLHGSKGDNLWGAMGRSFIKSILNSSKGFRDSDISDDAMAARRISSLSELDAIEFAAKIGIEETLGYGKKNIVKDAITPSHSKYDAVMGELVTANNVDLDDDLPDWG